jgi:hypothetical protein
MRRARCSEATVNEAVSNGAFSGCHQGGASSISVLREKLPDLPELAELDAYDARVLNQNDKVEVTLKLITPAPSGWQRLDQGQSRGPARS